MSNKRFIIGIDLGTTNCVLSYYDTQEKEGEIKILDIPQIVSPGELQELKLLPSFIYIPLEEEKRSNAFTLPWDPFGERIIGYYARKRGAEVEGRLVSSAKSWLCHHAVDRNAPILPLDADESIQKISPVVAQAILLRYLKAAWNYVVGKKYDTKMEEQDIYLTIPASFDAYARELTLKAARSAGLDEITLLEEPQAAFYAFLYHNKDTWRDILKVDDIILVCDIGGGTSDFSLIKVSQKDGELNLERSLVGDHLLLGGDNMDLSLTHYIMEELKKEGKNLTHKQFLSLVNSVRLSKEKILSGAESDDIIILGAGKGIIAGTLKYTLRKELVESLILDGFFPICNLTDFPEEEDTAGLTELSLPYCQDPRITRHIAKFLSGQRINGVLFNGGVFQARAFKDRVLEVLRNWYGPDIVEISQQDLSLSVALGAVYYGLVQRGEGIRIKAGLNRSYYIEVASPRPVIPGMPRKTKALCIAPQGTEEGTFLTLQDKTFGLIIGKPVVFNLLSSNIRPEDKLGDLIDDWEATIRPVHSIQTVVEMTGSQSVSETSTIPVQIASEVTTIGTLDIYLVNREKDLKTQLKFEIRKDE